MTEKDHHPGLNRSQPVNAVLITDAEAGKIVYADQALGAFVGLPPESLLGRTAADMCRKSDDGRARSLFSFLHDGPLRTSRTFPYTTLQGALGYAEITRHSILFDDKHYLIACLTDITHHRQALEALQKNEKLYRSALQTAREGIVTVDSIGNIITWNHAAEITFGYAAEEVLGTLFVFMLPERFRARQHQLFQDVIINRRIDLLIDAGEWIALHKDGREFPVEFSASVWESDGELFFTTIFRNIALRKNMEALLIKASKFESLGLLAQGIANDFNNLLAAVIGNIQNAQTAVQPHDSLFPVLCHAEEAALRARALTARLLTYATGGDPVRKCVGIGDLLRQTTEAVLRDTDITSEFDIANDLWPIWTDELLFTKVIHNIVLNAVEAMPRGGRLQVQARNVSATLNNSIPPSTGQYLRICISDQGHGIPKKFLTKVFEPYFTTRDTNLRKGRGMGLALVDSILKSHGGTIDITSEPDTGTTVTLYFKPCDKPLKTHRGTVKGARQLRLITPRQATKKRVLVLDDEMPVLLMLGDLLKLLGYEAELVRDGSAAVSLYQETMQSASPFDIVILDLNIQGGMGGKETLKKLFEINPSVVALASSGAGDSPVMQDCSAYGFCGVLPKPYTIHELRDVLDRFCR